MTLGRTINNEKNTYDTSTMILGRTINPFRTAVPFWGQNSQCSSSLSPKRDCGSKGVNNYKTRMIPEPRELINLFRTASSFSGQTIQILSSLSPKRGCSP